MPWPKGRPARPESTAKRVAALMANGKKRKKPVSVGAAGPLWMCPTCRVAKPAGDYHPDKRTANGLKSQCRACHGRGSIETRDPVKTRAARRASESNRRARKAGGARTVTASVLAHLVVIFGGPALACLKCRSRVGLTWDHIVPLAKGGAHAVENLQPLCRPCNERKQARAADYRTDEQRRAIEVWVVTFKQVGES